MTDYRYPVKLDAPGRRIVPDKCRVHSSNLNFILLTYGHRFQKDDHHDLSLVSIIYHSMQRQETDRISQWSLPSAPQITPVIDTGILRDMWVMFFFFCLKRKILFFMGNNIRPISAFTLWLRNRNNRKHIQKLLVERTRTCRAEQRPSRRKSNTDPEDGQVFSIVYRQSRCYSIFFFVIPISSYLTIVQLECGK